jgi:hypothetical protein
MCDKLIELPVLPCVRVDKTITVGRTLIGRGRNLRGVQKRGQRCLRTRLPGSIAACNQAQSGIRLQ